MTVNDIKAILLRQPLSQFFPGLSSVVRPADAEPAVDGDTVTITASGRHPGLIGVIAGYGDGEPKAGGTFFLADLLPGPCTVARPKDTAMILLPEGIGVRGCCDEDVGVMAHTRFGVGQEFRP